MQTTGSPEAQAPVAVARLVTFEAVLITALLLAELAVPTQLAQALGLDTVPDLECQEGHRSWVQGRAGTLAGKKTQ
jgi:hypothetical protein